MTVTITPVTAGRWPDPADLFGRGVVRPPGGPGGAGRPGGGAP
jgi:hypothetical protein